ncbi:MAG: flavin reductase family protein [Myxococcota bacterium]
MERSGADLSTSESYKLLTGCVSPRPIAFVSSVNPSGAVNLAPFSFFTAVGPNPMTLVFCPVARKDGSDKDTLRNVLRPEEGGVGEFVVNGAVERYARKIAATAEELPYGESEAEMAGFTLAPSRVVRAPRIAESPFAFECVTQHVYRTAPGVPFSGTLVVAEVVHAYIDDALINDKLHVDADKLASLGRMGGLDYARTRERFSMKSGRAILDTPPPFPEDHG